MISSSTKTPSQAGRSSLLLIGLVATFLCVVTFLPRVVLSASGMAKAQQSNKALAPYDERFATFARVERLLQSGTQKDAYEAGRLMDSTTSDPLLISDCDNVGENEKDTAFSSSILIAKLARQFDAAAARAIPTGTRPAPSDEATAFQWTQRARRIADTLMLSPHPTYSALKTAHYLDSVAGKREAAILRACGNAVEAATTEKLNASLKHVWHKEILPVLDRTERKQDANNQAAISVNPRCVVLDDAQWAAQIDYLVGLYQKERLFVSQA